LLLRRARCLQMLVPINHDVIVTAEEKLQEFFPRE
jgi:hypothetical protein